MSIEELREGRKRIVECGEEYICSALPVRFAFLFLRANRNRAARAYVRESKNWKYL